MVLIGNIDQAAAERSPQNTAMNSCARMVATLQQYQQRFARVLTHIDAHPDDCLSIDAMCAIAAFSRHHFHRQFSAYIGMSAYKYVQFIRMRRASWQLAFRDEPIVDIGMAAGYEAPEAFTRAFRQFSGQSPSEFRSAPDWPEWHSRFRPFLTLRKTIMQTKLSLSDVRLVAFPATRLAHIEHRGNPIHLGETIRKFIQFRKHHKLSPSSSATFNLVYNDPDETPPEAFHFGIGAAIDRAVPANDLGITEFLIPSGRCAVVRHHGSDDRLGDAIRYLYAEWLPWSGEETRDFPLYMQRLKFFPDVPEAEAITDIFLPLAS
jgi:AraC family transcriptional regulator